MALPEEREPGREPITIVEIDQDLCALTYGVAPCEAVLGVTGTQKCFNTRGTCQDTDNYQLFPGSPSDRNILTLRFAIPTDGLPRDQTIIPSVLEVTTRPTRINIVSGDEDYGPLGRRAEVTVTLRDHPWSDIIVDPYRTERTYDPLTRGTFWGKWLARNPFHAGRALRVLEGYQGQALADMTTRHYVIDRIEGPDQGEVRIIARDVLALTEGARAVAPAASTGKLGNGVDEFGGSPDQFTLTPEGVGDLEYPASGFARIGSEAVAFTRSGDLITLTERGRRGTTSAAHNEGDTFQLGYVVDDTRIDSVAFELLTTYAGIDTSFITFSDWQSEADAWQSTVLLSVEIYDPTPVDRLLGEILTQTYTYIWIDDRSQKIRYRPLRPVVPDTDEVETLTEETNIVADSVTIERDPRQRISRVHVYYDQTNPLGSVDDPANYSRLTVFTDDDAETDEEYGEVRIREIFARWLDADNEAEVNVLGTRLLARYRDDPAEIRFSLDAKDRDIWTGAVVDFTDRSIQDATGASVSTRLQVLSAEEAVSGHRVDYVATVFAFAAGDRQAFILDDESPTVFFTGASDAEKAAGAWIAGNDGTMSDGSDAYLII